LLPDYNEIQVAAVCATASPAGESSSRPTYPERVGSRKGWVPRLEDRAAADARLSALLGRQLTGVRYIELGYDEPAWDVGRFHTVDYGIELDLEDGATWAVIWQQQGANETPLTYRGLIRDELRPEADVSTWDVTNVWQTRFGRGGDRLETVWTKHRLDQEETRCPGAAPVSRAVRYAHAGGLAGQSGPRVRRRRVTA
jgi:hypothetical protein